MADPPRNPDSGDHTGVGPDREPTTGIPRWVWVLGIVVLLVVLAVAAVMLTAGGGHKPIPGPGGH